MRFRFAKMSLMVLLLGLAFVPAGAGPYHTRYWLSSGGLAVSALSDGSTGAVGVWEVQNGYHTGNFAWPIGFSGVGPANLEPKTSYVGCIVIWKASAIDGGCEIAPPTSINVDPAMRTATLAFSVLNSQGYTLTASIVLEGTDAPGPLEETLEPVISSDPSDGFPRIAFARGVVGVGRVASVQGAMRSEMLNLGGGTRTRSGVTQLGFLTRGLFRPVRVGNTMEFRPGADVYLDTNKPVCVGTGDNPPCQVP